MFWITVDVADDDHVLSFDNILLVITYWSAYYLMLHYIELHLI